MNQERPAIVRPPRAILDALRAAGDQRGERLTDGEGIHVLTGTAGGARLSRPAQSPLLRLPAASDNAAMQTEPLKSDPPKRKRRWFQFSLRTLMIVVTLLALPLGYVGWQARIVRDRKVVLSAIRDRGGHVVEASTVPFLKPWATISSFRTDQNAQQVFL
jgi:hypothetical protein